MTLLNYGYSVSALYEDENKDPLGKLKVAGGVEDEVPLLYEGSFRYLDIEMCIRDRPMTLILRQTAV